MSEPNWKALESNPEVVNPYVNSLGIKTDQFLFTDLYSLEDWAKNAVPKPVLGLLVCFPCTANQQAYAEEKFLKYSTPAPQVGGEKKMKEEGHENKGKDGEKKEEGHSEKGEHKKKEAEHSHEEKHEHKTEKHAEKEHKEEEKHKPKAETHGEKHVEKTPQPEEKHEAKTDKHEAKDKKPEEKHDDKHSKTDESHKSDHPKEPHNKHDDPIHKAHEAHAKPAEKKPDHPEKAAEAHPQEPLFYMFQYAHNACGTVALYHLYSNLTSTHPELFEPTSLILKFKESAKSKNFEERGHIFADYKEAKEIHEKFVEVGETEVCEEVSSHFISFVRFNGKLVELDGAKKGPLWLDDCTEEEFLDKSCAEVKKMMDRDPENIGFSMIVLAKKQE